MYKKKHISESLSNREQGKFYVCRLGSMICEFSQRIALIKRFSSLKRTSHFCHGFNQTLTPAIFKIVCIGPRERLRPSMIVSSPIKLWKLE